MFFRLVVGPDSIMSSLGSLARTSRNPKALVRLYGVLFCPVTQQHTNSPVVLVQSTAATEAAAAAGTVAAAAVGRVGLSLCGEGVREFDVSIVFFVFVFLVA